MMSDQHQPRRRNSAASYARAVRRALRAHQSPEAFAAQLATLAAKGSSTALKLCADAYAVDAPPPRRPEALMPVSRSLAALTTSELIVLRWLTRKAEGIDPGPPPPMPKEWAPPPPPIVVRGLLTAAPTPSPSPAPQENAAPPAQISSVLARETSADGSTAVAPADRATVTQTQNSRARTKQRRWQLKMRALGRCTHCGEAHGTGHAQCAKCRAAKNARLRSLYHQRRAAGPMLVPTPESAPAPEPAPTPIPFPEPALTSGLERRSEFEFPLAVYSLPAMQRR